MPVEYPGGGGSSNPSLGGDASGTASNAVIWDHTTYPGYAALPSGVLVPANLISSVGGTQFIDPTALPAGGITGSQIAANAAIAASQVNTALYGTLSARPSAASVGDRTKYYATDQNGGTWYQVQSGSWVQVTKGLTALPVSHGSTHDPSGTDPMYLERGHTMGGHGGVGIVDRYFDCMDLWEARNQLTPTMGTLFCSYFTADAAKAVTTFFWMPTNGTWSGLTHGWLLLYSVASNGDLTLVARTADDTTINGTTDLANATSANYGAAFRALGYDGSGNSISSYSLTYGQRYAIGILGIGGTGSPQLRATDGFGPSALFGARRCALSPGSQTGLISSMTNATLAGQAAPQAVWFAVG